MSGSRLVTRPVDAACWDDIVALFGARGARQGCWCMRWRQGRDEFERGKGEINRELLRDGIAAGEVHGVLGYLDGAPVGWCSVAPRERLPGLRESEALAPVDARRVWAVSCFFIARHARRQGFAVDLLRAAVDEASHRGATLVEGYPLDPPVAKIPVAATWTGLLSTFLAAGFAEVCRRAPARPIVHLEVRR